MAFLDNTGLSHLWDKIKTALSGKLDTTGNAYRAASIPFAQVDDTSTSTVFTATVPGITELRSGVCVFLMNGVVTSASGFTININGLGAKPVYSTLAAGSRATTLFNVAYTLFLVYNEERVSGGCWDAYYGYDSNTNTIGYQLRTTATTMPTLDKFYRYRLLFTSADRHHFVPANTSSSTSADTAKTTTQRPIDPFGAIYYYGHTTAINANANPTASYFWTQYSFALGYSFNRKGSALTLTNHAPVYIKCAPQSDGSAIIDADTPFVQTLPSTADGKIYIFLGIASSATAVELVPEHPVFCYRNGQIRPWTGNSGAVESVNGMTGAVTVKTPYYLTVTTENYTVYVDKTPAEIDALSAAGYDVHIRTQIPLFGAMLDMRFIGYISQTGYAAFTGEYLGVCFAALVALDKTVEIKSNDLAERLDMVEDQVSQIGTVFTLKGGVATVNDLPQTDNQIGDVWYVESVSSGFIWLTSTANPGGYWEELGRTIDLSAYAEKTWVQNQGYQTAQDVQTAISGVRQLPAVTTSDNGKFLRVVNGAWAAETIQTWQGGSY